MLQILNVLVHVNKVKLQDHFVMYVKKIYHVLFGTKIKLLIKF